VRRTAARTEGRFFVMRAVYQGPLRRHLGRPASSHGSFWPIPFPPWLHYSVDLAIGIRRYITEMKCAAGRSLGRMIPPIDQPEPTKMLSKGWSRVALAGIAGVGGFIGAWASAGAVRDGYSPVHDAISQLAAIDAPNRSLMTGGFVAFGVGIPIYAQALRRALPGPAWIAATLTGLSTLGVAASPLGRADTAHYLFAGAGYITLAATPLLASRTFRTEGSRTWATWSTRCGLGSAAVLTASLADPGHGITQRLGLGITDAWIVASAWSLYRSGRVASTNAA